MGYYSVASVSFCEIPAVWYGRSERLSERDGLIDGFFCRGGGRRYGGVAMLADGGAVFTAQAAEDE